jgi:hypothetical protein
MAKSIEKRLDLHRQSRQQGVDHRLAADGDLTAKGVTTAWLSTAFKMPEPTVRYRLRGCPIKATKTRGTKMKVHLYDLRTAAGFLVAPAFSTKEYMKALKKGDLPPALQQSVWDAMLKRQKWEENAGDLWRTDQIREVLGSTFQTIKFTVQLWADTVERQVQLSEDQRRIIIEMSDALQGAIFDALVKQMNENMTGPQLAELEQRFGDSERIETIMADDADEDDEDAEIEDMV